VVDRRSRGSGVDRIRDTIAGLLDVLGDMNTATTIGPSAARPCPNEFLQLSTWVHIVSTQVDRI